MANQTTERVPVTVLGGYLGSGKTTLLNRLLRSSSERIAVIINDFGETAIDDDLIVGQDGETLTLANGCVCCSMAAGLAAGLRSVVDRGAPPERVVIEVSGVGDPGRVAQYGKMPGFRVDAVVTLADVEAVRGHAQDRYVGETVIAQLQSADIIALTKLDLAPTSEAAVRSWLAEVSPGVPVVPASDELLDLNLPERGSTAQRTSAAPPTSTGAHTFVTETVHFSAPVSEEELRAAMASLGDEVVRAKGIVRVATSDAESTLVVNRAGRRLEIVASLMPSTSSRLVLIGHPGSDLSEALALVEALHG